MYVCLKIQMDWQRVMSPEMHAKHVNSSGSLVKLIICKRMHIVTQRYRLQFDSHVVLISKYNLQVRTRILKGHQVKDISFQLKCDIERL